MCCLQANFAIECAVTRMANRDISIEVAANSFADQSGNGNVASFAGKTATDATLHAPFLVTQDEGVPTMLITIYEADGETVIPDAGTTGSKAALFKLQTSEHIVTTVSPWVAATSAIMSTAANCAGLKFWGWKDTFYIRCDWANGVEVTMGAGANEFMVRRNNFAVLIQELDCICHFCHRRCAGPCGERQCRSDCSHGDVHLTFPVMPTGFFVGAALVLDVRSAKEVNTTTLVSTYIFS